MRAWVPKRSAHIAARAISLTMRAWRMDVQYACDTGLLLVCICSSMYFLDLTSISTPHLSYFDCTVYVPQAQLDALHSEQEQVTANGDAASRSSRDLAPVARSLEAALAAGSVQPAKCSGQPVEDLSLRLEELCSQKVELQVGFCVSVSNLYGIFTYLLGATP